MQHKEGVEDTIRVCSRSRVSFFRPDRDRYADHFDFAGNEVEHKSNVGFYTINAADLNRESLQRVRDLRRRFHQTNEAVLAGIAALRNFPIDRLPSNLKGPAAGAIRQIGEHGQKVTGALDQLLREHAKSPLLDEDLSKAARRVQRSTNLRALEALYPKAWAAETPASEVI